VKLEVPDIELGEDPVAVARDRSIVSQLESVMEKWGMIISRTVDEQLKKVPQGNGPLAEVDFWKERSSALSAVYEQVKLPAVQHVLAILNEANVASFSNFEYHRSELNKYYLEARDNVKFLGTLERHLKNLAHGANFTIVLETLPALMNSLRMVWVISRHYNTDERMVPMMERIAWEICERVARVVNVKTVFRYSVRVTLFGARRCTTSHVVNSGFPLLD
jgi:dynein heavy chain